jgi:hypothetical protein
VALPDFVTNFPLFAPPKLRTQANVPPGEYFAKKPLFPERLAVPGPGSKSVVPLEAPATKTFPDASVATELPPPL